MEGNRLTMPRYFRQKAEKKKRLFPVVRDRKLSLREGWKSSVHLHQPL